MNDGQVRNATTHTIFQFHLSLLKQAADALACFNGEGWWIGGLSVEDSVEHQLFVTVPNFDEEKTIGSIMY